LTLLAIAHGCVQPAPQSFTQGFGHNQTLAFNILHYPMRQRGNSHACRHHLNQQQRVIDTFQRRTYARWLQEMPPDIQTLALDRVNQ